MSTREFEVDLEARLVREKSGAIVSFYEYASEDEWKACDVGSIQNLHLFEGSPRELLAGAKAEALAAGMTHRKPTTCVPDWGSLNLQLSS